MTVIRYFGLFFVFMMLGACQQQADEKSQGEVSAKAEVSAHEHGHEHEESEHEAAVVLTPEQAAAADLMVANAGPATITETVTLQGDIRVAADAELLVLAPVSAVAVSVPVVLGQWVKAGEPLAILESRELAELKRNYLTAKATAELAHNDFKREDMLWKEKITAEQDYWQAKNRKAEADIRLASDKAALLAYGLRASDLVSLRLESPENLSQWVLRAPRSGRVTQRNIVAGQRVSQDSPIFTIADTKQLVAVLSASPQQQAVLLLQQRVQLTQVDGLVTGEGRVSVIIPPLENSDRRSRIYVALSDAEKWQAGQFVQAAILAAEKPVAVAVHREAIQNLDGKPSVFVLHDGKYDAVQVALGQQDQQFVEVLSGLKAGQEYVQKNSFLLKAELGKAETEHEH